MNKSEFVLASLFSIILFLWGFFFYSLFLTFIVWRFTISFFLLLISLLLFSFFADPAQGIIPDVE